MAISEHQPISRERLKTIARSIADGREEEARSLYREATGKGLVEVTDFIEKLKLDLKRKYPSRFANTISQHPPAVASIDVPEQSQPTNIWHGIVPRIRAAALAGSRHLLRGSRHGVYALGRMLAASWDRQTFKQKAIAVFLIVLIVQVVIGGRHARLSHRNQNEDLPSAESRIPTTSSPTGDKSSFKLQMKDGTFVPMCKSKSDYDRVGQLAAAGDNLGISQMLASGRAFEVASGTKCIVIDYGMFSSEVRITEGPQKGESGWVPTEFMRH